MHINLDHEKSTPPHFNKSLPEEPPGRKEPALEELRRMGRELLAIRLHLEKQSQNSQHSEDWNKIANVIDRLLFLIYLLFITVSFITIACLWAQSSV